MTFSDRMYCRARAAAFQAALALVFSLAFAASGLLTLRTDGFIGWLLCSAGVILMGVSLMRSRKAWNLTRLAMDQEAKEWGKALGIL